MLLPLLRHAFAWPKLERSGVALPIAASPTDILQFFGRYEVYLDVPGVDHTSINIELYDNYLLISGAVKGPDVQRDEEDQAVWLRRDRPALGSFQQAFALPADVDLDSIKANLDKGVLKVVLPRITLKQPKKTISVSKL